jgi:Holliday junction DNA helicase RuvA
MISQLTGVIAHRDARTVVLDVAGVGYKIYTTPDTLAKLPRGETPVKLWTHLSVRENALDLYGFLSKEDLDFFELVITISGIGPKRALGILSSTTFEVVRKAVSSGDVLYLQKLSGIGKKNAEKIVLELRDKMGAIAETPEELRDELDVFEALKALGYSAGEIKEVMKKVPGTTTGTNNRIKSALRLLAR